MNNFESMTDQVISYLKENQYCVSLIQAYERCFEKLGSYLSEQGIPYTPDIASEWYSQKDSLSPSDRCHGKMAIIRLQDVAETGCIREEHETRQLMSYTILSETLRSALETYLNAKSKMLSAATIENHRHSCAKFLAYAQKHGVQTVHDITAEVISGFYHDAVYFGIYNKSMVNSNVASMMDFFYEKGDLPYSCTLILHYLSHSKSHTCFWNDILPETRSKISDIINSSRTISSDILRRYKDVLTDTHRENGYSKSVISTNIRAIDLLILFLEMNGYNYSYEISMLWLNDVRPALGKQAYSFRRALCLIADFHCTSHFPITDMYCEKKSSFYNLPAWCSEPAEQYIRTKENEGWKKSTLTTIRSSIVRFCLFLDQEGIRSFADVDVSHIKGFNRKDFHKTPYGKNAYNTRIRKFLIYLGENHYLSNPMLFAALSCVSAPKETIVVVLSESEMSELKEQLDSDNSRLSQRKKAMLLLGLKMGLRASDIVNLSIDDINWKSMSVRFVQKKTSVEVNLPMPTEVGNALFRYITEERGFKASPEIFLSEKAPHKPVGCATCNAALKTALPERNVPGSGFHVTRKTYATSLLKNGIGADIVAEALGQRGTASVHRYLSLDTERMRMCSVSMAEYGIGGWTNED